MSAAEIYKILHLLGVMFLFAGIGLAVASGDQRKLGIASHGIGLLVILVAGFGMVAKLKYGFPAWVIVKVVLWLGLGAVPVLAKKGVLKPAGAWAAALVLGGAAAYLGVHKGFL